MREDVKEMKRLTKQSWWAFGIGMILMFAFSQSIVALGKHFNNPELLWLTPLSLVSLIPWILISRKLRRSIELVGQNTQKQMEFRLEEEHKEYPVYIWSGDSNANEP